MDMLKELKLTTFGQYLDGKKFMQLGSDEIRSYSSDIPSLSPLALLDLNRLINKVRFEKTVTACMKLLWLFIICI